MKTLADLKRRIKPGVVVQVSNHYYPDLNGERTIVNAQTKRFSMTLPATHPKAGTASWVTYPRAEFIRIEGDTATILHDEGFAEIREGSDFFTITFPTGD